MVIMSAKNKVGRLKRVAAKPSGLTSPKSNAESAVTAAGLSTMKTDLTCVQTEVTAMKMGMNSLQNLVRDLENKLTKIDTEIQGDMNNNSLLAGDVTDLRAQVGNALRQATSASAAATSVATTIAGGEARLSGVEQSQTNLQGTMQQLDTFIKSQVAQLETRIHGVENMPRTTGSTT